MGTSLSFWLLWSLLARLSGSPLLALAGVAALFWLGDRVAFRVIPDPLRPLGRLRRIGQLRRALQVNPHDRRARLELAGFLLERRRPAEAAAVLRPNIEAGDEDVHTAYTMGAALGRSGQPEAAERALAIARQLEPGFRAGEIDLELGRQRVARGDLAGAREALERLLAIRVGSVEGRYWLSRALEGLGDRERARQVRDQAARDYAALPRFQRQKERPFAWRMRPLAPALGFAAVALAVLLLVAAIRAGSAVGGSAAGDRAGAADSED